MPKKVLIDTDPGGDDIYSIFWLQSLMRQEVVELLAIATTEGNVSARNTFNAACQVLRLADIDTVAVGRGVEVPDRYFANASHIHGDDGMGNLSQTLPPGRRRFHESLISDDLIIRVLKAHPYEVTLVAIAPLSNLAAAEEKEPGILRLAKEVVIMGGAFDTPGNITPVAEFNMAFNPKAAQRVFASREDLVILPLDVTRQLVFTPEMLRQVTGLEPKNPLAQFMADLARFLMTTTLHYRETGGQRGFLVHDAVAVAYLVYPELFTFSRALVSIETEGRLTTGQTLCDRRHGFKTGVNAWIAQEVDAKNLLACLVEDLHHLAEHSSVYT